MSSLIVEYNTHTVEFVRCDLDLLTIHCGPLSVFSRIENVRLIYLVTQSLYMLRAPNISLTLDLETAHSLSIMLDVDIQHRDDLNITD